MRGTREGAPLARTGEGLIPTYAGNTNILPALHGHFGAHPHVCGEHTRARASLLILGGSSPRMRGTPAATVVLIASWGLIPTYAGNTEICAVLFPLRWAHPHVCGEHGYAPLRNRRAWGSSPRMRGTPPTAYPALLIFGLIPTYAGNTRAHQNHHPQGGAHPHVCGEHFLRVYLLFLEVGSSPRMRGTLRVNSSAPLLTWAHPHVCGEHLKSTPHRLAMKGSSPRMRGTLSAAAFVSWAAGLIPTYAGNT